MVVVEPAALIDPDDAGLRMLYVTLTRATRDLTVLHAEALPEALVVAAARLGESEGGAGDGAVVARGGH